MPTDRAKFAIQADVRGPWRAFLDEIAPLRPELFRYCCGLTGNVWDGEDLVQDTLARVFSLLGKTDADLSHPRAYLVRAATHLWIDRLRRAGVERSHAESSAPEGREREDPTQAIAVREAASVLFLRLPTQERAAVLLKDVLDFSLEETAAMLKTSVGAVKSALHRGRERLRAAREEPLATVRTGSPELVDRFVEALAAKDFEAIRAMCLADATIDMVGGIRAETYEQGKMVVEHAHMVLPDWGFGENPHWEVAEWDGEPIAIGFRTLGGVEGLNEVWRFETGDDGRVTRVRLYCFTPDVLAAVAQGLGLTALKRPYRSPP
jgi:RNA polymerase sigma-70 factor (ECF subfamily)